MSDCGSCKWFVKLKRDRIGGGLCEYGDARTKSDYGHGCSNHRGMKYKRHPKYKSKATHKSDL